jgi:hypothetical protein
MLSTPDILDNKGQQIQLPVLFPMSEEMVEQRQAAKGAIDAAVLKSFAEDPTATERERAAPLGLKQPTLHYRMKKLVEMRFLEPGADGKHRLTAKGRKELLRIVPKSPADDWA